MPVPTTMALHGYEGLPVQVECRLSRGLPALLIVGQASRAVSEARERVRAAMASTGFPLPAERIVINLSPADLPKSGTVFDLAIAAAILAAVNPTLRLAPRSFLLGELGLDGSVKPVRGLIASLLSARAAGYTTAYIPAAQATQAVIVPDVRIIPVQSLRELQRDMTTAAYLPRLATGIAAQQPAIYQHDFASVTGQARLKRGLEIAAAGGHHSLLTGAPGTGKSLLAKALSSILPPLSQDQVLEVNRLHGLGEGSGSLLLTAPCRAPHHSATLAALLGGGWPLRPGEVSLAHHGVLILDELPEFSRIALESLRQPLEDTSVTIARAQGSVVLPANFTLVATANPCACGFAGTGRVCRCPPGKLLAYQQKLSGPLLDRIDLYLEAEGTEHVTLLDAHSAEPSDVIRKRVTAARQRQAERQGPRLNADLTPEQLQRYAQLEPEAKRLLDSAGGRLQLSARAYVRTAKVARSIADLADSKTVLEAHVSEALQYRHRQNP